MASAASTTCFSLALICRSTRRESVGEGCGEGCACGAGVAALFAGAEDPCPWLRAPMAALSIISRHTSRKCFIALVSFNQLSEVERYYRGPRSIGTQRKARRFHLLRALYL